MKVFVFLGFSVFFGTAYAAGAYSGVVACEQFAKKMLGEKNDDRKFAQTLDFFWAQNMKEYPEWATYLGVPGGDDRWTDRSLETLEKRKQVPVCQERILAKINSKKLSEKNKLTYKLLVKDIKNQIKFSEFGGDYLQVDQMGGIHMDIADIMIAAPKNNIHDFENRLSRLESFPTAIDQTIRLLEEGVKQKITPVKFLIEKIPDQISKVIAKDPKNSPIYKAFTEMPASISEAERTSILARAETAIAAKVNPSLEKFKTFIQEKYIPGCRTEIAYSSMPKGKEWYELLASTHTTTSLTPQQIHQIGLNEVDRINKDMTKVREQLKYKGTKADFHKFLQTDSQFYFSNPKDLISQYQVIAKQIDSQLPGQFSVLPRLSYGVREMPAYKSADAPTAYYMTGSLKSGRAGYFEANTYNLKSRPKWEMEALTVHEAVPGHHLQISLAQELGDMPEFRKNKFYTAFVEGWGLYSESLGDDLGLYKDLYSKYGQHVFEMWRAVRLVVDTGMHTMGWSKQKALDYFMDNIPKDRLQSENEIDRYISMPGQALAYKIGELKIKELKKRAQEKLHAKFDVREFHNQILRHGAVPMDVLEEEFNNWLNKKQTSKLN